MMFAVRYATDASTRTTEPAARCDTFADAIDALHVESLVADITAPATPQNPLRLHIVDEASGQVECELISGGGYTRGDFFDLYEH